MTLLSRLIDWATPDDEANEEYQEFRRRREWERDVWDSAVKHWLLHSGLAPVMIEQTRQDYGSLEGVEEWPPEQMEHYAQMEFDERRDDHARIKEYVNQSKEERTGTLERKVDELGGR
jgi:hypothetical protein